MHMIENGNVAAALGVKLAGAQVIAAYPITPQTPLTEKLSEFIESGEMKAQYVPVESEHTALRSASRLHPPAPGRSPPPAPTGCSICTSRSTGRQAPGCPSSCAW